MPLLVESKSKKELLLFSPIMTSRLITKRNPLECVYFLKKIVPWLNLDVLTELKSLQNQTNLEKAPF